MKKYAFISITLFLTVSLVGCVKKSDELSTVPSVIIAETESVTKTTAAETVITESTSPSASMDFMSIARKELTDTLDDIYLSNTGEDVQMASNLMNWGVGTPLYGYDDMINQTTQDWLNQKSNADKEVFKKKFTSIYEMYQKLLGSDAEKILKSANITNAAYPWSDEPIDTIESIAKSLNLVNN